MQKFDIMIIGGGAAGLCAAITAKRENKTMSVAIAERSDRVGKKLLTTGNGRCNLSNSDISPDRYHGGSVDFINSVLSKFTVSDTKEFFRSVGVECEDDGTGRIFPSSYQASSVVDALRYTVEELGITVLLNTKVTDLKKNGNLISVISDNGEFICKKVILTSGGLAGGEKVGCDRTGYSIAESTGHKTIKCHPAITQIKTDTSVIRRFKGIKVNASVSVFCKGKKLRTENGEVLFCDYGISGPPVFQLSGSISGKENCTAVIDFMPEITAQDLKKLLISRRDTLSLRVTPEFFTGLMNKRVGQYFAKLSDAEYSGKITDGEIDKMVSAIKGFNLSIKGTGDFYAAQVTKGGVDCRDINCDTLASEKFGSLYFAGEIIDVDGDCGGYNLQWAWASATVAAKSAARETV